MAAARPAGGDATDGYYVLAPAPHLNTHLVLPGLTIFQSQYNITREIVQRVRAHLPLGTLFTPPPAAVGAGAPPLPAARRFTALNFLFAGPTFVALRDQTRDDVREFITHLRANATLAPLFPATSADMTHFIEMRVLNSDQLHKKATQADFDALSWVQLLTQSPHSQLHLLVLEEAHWGLKSGGEMDTWMQRLDACIGQVKAKTGAALGVRELAVPALQRTQEYLGCFPELGYAQRSLSQLACDARERMQCRFGACGSSSPPCRCVIVLHRCNAGCSRCVAAPLVSCLSRIDEARVALCGGASPTRTALRVIDRFRELIDDK